MVDINPTTGIDWKTYTGSRSDRNVVINHLKSEGRDIHLGNVEDHLAEILGKHEASRLESQLANQVRRENLGFLGRSTEDIARFKNFTGITAAGEKLRGAGKLLLLGGAVAGGVALLSGMFSGKNKKGVNEASFDAEREVQAAESLPSPNAMVMAAGPESLLPPGVAPQPGALANSVRPNGPLSLTDMANRDASSPVLNMGA